MEPLSAAAIAIASIILTKSLETTGEKLGEAFSKQVGQMVKLIKNKHLPKSSAVISNSITATFDGAVIELEQAVNTDNELQTSVRKLQEIVLFNPEISAKVQLAAHEISRSENIFNNSGKLADTVGVFSYKGVVNIETLDLRGN